MDVLKNKNIVITRAEEPSTETVNYFANLGVNLISFPALEAVQADASEELKTILAEGKIDYVVFQSANSVKFFTQLVKENNPNLDLETVRVACHGKKTETYCRRNEIKIDMLPVDHSLSGLIKLFSREEMKNKVVLLPYAGSGMDELRDHLINMEAKVKTVVVYEFKIPVKETVAAEIEKVKNNEINWYVFTSAETYHNFLQLLEVESPLKFFTNCKIAVAGLPTKEAVHKSGVHFDVFVKKLATTHLMELIAKYYTEPVVKHGAGKNRLKNKTVVLTRTEEQSQETINFFKNKEINLISFPALEVVPVDASEKLKLILEENTIDYLVFQSANAVKHFVQLIKENNLNVDFEKMKVACVGKKTEAICTENDIHVDLVPEDYSALGLLKLFAIEPLENKTVLLPRSAIGRDEFREGLKRFGASVKTVAVYDIKIPARPSVADVIETIRTTKVNWYLFTSPSTYQNFCALMEIKNPRVFFNGRKIAAIGPTTKEAIERTGILVDVVPEKFSVTHAITSMEKYDAKRRPKKQKLPKQPKLPPRPSDTKVVRYVLKKRKPKNEN